MFQRSSQKETVVIVHGTFANPERHPHRLWYMPGGSFCEALNRLLIAKGSAARCWDHLRPGERFFSWEGDNTWHARARASERLRTLVLELQEQGYVVHLVGHSHGGNVIREAITSSRGELFDWFRGGVVLLGTPILGLSPKYHKLERLKAVGLATLAVCIWLAYFAYASARFDHSQFYGASNLYRYGLFALIAISLIAGLVAVGKVASALGITSGAFVRKAYDLITSIAVTLQGGIAPLMYALSLFLGWLDRILGRAPVPASRRILIISSAQDEAYRLLKGIIRSENPLIEKEKYTDSKRVSLVWRVMRKIPKGVHRIGAIWRLSARATIVMVRRYVSEQQWEVLTLAGGLTLVSFSLGVLAFYSLSYDFFKPYQAEIILLNAAWLTIMLCLTARRDGVGALAFTLPFVCAGAIVMFAKHLVTGFRSTLLDGVMKSLAWSTVQTFAFGAGGAPWRVAQLDVYQQFQAPLDHISVFREAPKVPVASVLEQQRRTFGTLHQRLFDKPAELGVLDVFRRAAEETGEIPLVHGMYYAEAECITWCADWIVTSSPRQPQRSWSLLPGVFGSSRPLPPYVGPLAR
jgi:hypothetical protein